MSFRDPYCCVCEPRRWNGVVLYHHKMRSGTVVVEAPSVVRPRIWRRRLMDEQIGGERFEESNQTFMAVRSGWVCLDAAVNHRSVSANIARRRKYALLSLAGTGARDATSSRRRSR